MKFYSKLIPNFLHSFFTALRQRYLPNDAPKGNGSRIGIAKVRTKSTTRLSIQLPNATARSKRITARHLNTTNLSWFFCLEIPQFKGLVTLFDSKILSWYFLYSSLNLNVALTTNAAIHSSKNAIVKAITISIKNFFV